MEQARIERGPKKTDNNANQTGYYTSLAVIIFVGIVGVFLRFVPEIITSLDQMQFTFSLVSNILLLIASVFAFKTVFGILGFGKKA